MLMKKNIDCDNCFLALRDSDDNVWIGLIFPRNVFDRERGKEWRIEARMHVSQFKLRLFMFTNSSIISALEEYNK